MTPLRHIVQLFALLTFPLVLCFSLAFSLGCASDQAKVPVRLPSRSDFSMGIKPPLPPCTSFMTWRAGSSFDGRLIAQQLIADGDAACSAGQTASASQYYLRAASVPLSMSDARELAVRRAALALSHGSPSDALALLNAHLRRFPNGETLSDFGYLLGAAYAGTGDVDQAIAWWSKVYIAEHGTGALANKSKEGAFQLLRRVDDGSLERAQATWRDDDMVRTVLAQARANRLSPGQMQDRITVDSQMPVEALATGQNVGVLLPLSGRFQALGERAKRGVELALSVQANPATLIAVDSGESATLVSQKLSELIKGGVNTIIGPLLAEQVEDVALGAPAGAIVLSLSKRSPSVDAPGFMTLGITAESQVDSILNHAQALGVTQIAVLGSQEAMQTFGQLARDGMRDRGMSLSFERAFGREDIAAATDLGREVAASASQAVLFLDNPSIAANIAAGIPEADRRTLKVLGLASWDSEAQLQQSRAVLDGARFVSGFARTSAREVIHNFVATYQQRYREMPDVVAAQGFDAASLVLAARARQQAGGSIVSAFHELPPYEGLTGRIETKPNGAVVRSLAVLEFRDGQLTELP